MLHAYPHHLAAFAAERWDAAGNGGTGIGSASAGKAGAGRKSACLPDSATLEAILSTCYQASLLREEERPVTFRLIVLEPDCFADDDGPPAGFHRLSFEQPRQFDADELRRLSPAAEFHRTVIGLRSDTDGQTIWGLVATGPRWIQAAQGGRARSPVLPDALVVCVTGPGRVVVCRGSVTIATLHGGCLTCPALDVFSAAWLRDAFAEVREELYVLHAAGHVAGAHARRMLDDGVISQLSQHVVRRILSVVRSSRHGATLLFLPPETADRCEHQHSLNIKYRFTAGPSRRRFRTLLLQIMDALTQGEPSERPAGWHDYVFSKAEVIAELDEAIFEVAHLLAGLTAVDGAVVLTKRFEVLGFGAEISGGLADVPEVLRALDAEGRQTAAESVAGVGTRHRSAYRLCGLLPEMLAIVISQDGGVRFCKQTAGRVVYWDQAAVGSRDV